MLRHVSERMQLKMVRPEDSDGGDYRNINSVTDSYAAALYAGNGLFRLASVFTFTSRDAVLLTSILHTTVLALCFSAFLLIILRGNFRVNWFNILLITYVGLVFLDSFNYSVYLNSPYWNNNLLTYRSNTLRLVNPTLFWAAGLAAAASIVKTIQGEKRVSVLLVAASLACLTGLFSISVGATLTLALGMSIALEALCNRTINWRLISIAVAAAVGLAWGYMQLIMYSTTPLGQQLRHGEFLGLNLKWHFLFLLGLIPFIWNMLGKERIFVAALVTAAVIVGVFCDSFNLGSRLWIRGAVIYAWAVTVFVTIRIVLYCIKSSRIMIWRGLPALQVATIALMVIFVYLVQKPDVKSWKGFVERERWELLNWMEQHLPADSVIASADIEDAFLIPIYTKSRPLYAMYGVTSRSHDEELRRYFFTMRIFGRDRQLLDYVLNLKSEDMIRYNNYVMDKVPAPAKGDVEDAIIFLKLVVYHSYIKEFSNALTNPMQHQILEKVLRTRADEALHSNYSFDFAIVERGHSAPLGSSGWPVVFTNGRYSVLKVPFVAKSHN